MRRFVSTAGILALVLVVLGVAGSGNLATAAKPQPPRFVDNGNGTITDKQTGLMWEKKLAADDSQGNCADDSQANRGIHCGNNVYHWSITLSDPDGSIFTDFLRRINAALSTSSDGITVADVCFAGHCDWRVPNIAELRTILLAPYPPIFLPTAVDFYWSSSSDATFPASAWGVNFASGDVNVNGKLGPLGVRAVRGGP